MQPRLSELRLTEPFGYPNIGQSPILIPLCINWPRLSEQFRLVPTNSDNRGCKSQCWRNNFHVVIFISATCAASGTNLTMSVTQLKKVPLLCDPLPIFGARSYRSFHGIFIRLNHYIIVKTKIFASVFKAFSHFPAELRLLLDLCHLWHR